VQKLEEKLDGIVLLLRSGNDITSGNEPYSMTTTARIATTDMPEQALDFTRQLEPQGFPTPDTPSASHRSFQIMTQIGSVPKVLGSPPANGHDFELHKANDLLDIFRNQMSKYFPFVNISQATSAEELRLKRPFLYMCILAATTRDCSEQARLGKQVMEQLTEKVFVCGERNIDLLLGVLTYSGWYVIPDLILLLEFIIRSSDPLIIMFAFRGFWCCFAKPQYTSLMATAMVLIWDLGLSRPIPMEYHKNIFESAFAGSGPPSPERSLEERRAFLGSYFLIFSYVAVRL
jgi:hypothetical protein